MESYSTQSLIDELLSRHNSLELEHELIDTILEQTLYIDQDAYIQFNLSLDEAAQFLAASDDPFDTLMEHADPSPDFMLSRLPSAETLAYHLGYGDPAYGKVLLDELVYYQSKGRL